jgi:hypothetical protein
MRDLLEPAADVNEEGPSRGTGEAEFAWQALTAMRSSPALRIRFRGVAFANLIFHFHRPHPAIKGLLRNTLRDDHLHFWSGRWAARC